MSDKQGIATVDALQIAFIVLKLTGVISWRWIWVLFPTWISIIVVIIAIVSIKILE